MSDRELLETIMYQLYRWAKLSQSGGWSTHQVEPQRKLASQIAEHLATTEPGHELLMEYVRRLAERPCEFSGTACQLDGTSTLCIWCQAKKILVQVKGGAQ